MTKYRRYESLYLVDLNKFSIYGSLSSNNHDKSLELGQEVTIDITDVDEDGRGLGNYLGYRIHVPKALVGERVRVKVIKIKGVEVIARVVKRLHGFQY